MCFGREGSALTRETLALPTLSCCCEYSPVVVRALGGGDRYPRSGQAVDLPCHFGQSGSPLYTFSRQGPSYPFIQSQVTGPERAGRAVPTVFVYRLPPWGCAAQLVKLIAATRHTEQAWRKWGKRRRGTLSLPCSPDIVVLACQASPWMNLMRAERLHELYELELPWDTRVTLGCRSGL